MKKILLSFVAAFVVLLSHAQESHQSQQAEIKKGTVFIGGNIGFSHLSSKSDDSLYAPDNPGTNFNFNPSVGWAIKDNLVFGINLGYSYQKTNYANPGSYYELNNYSAGVFLRKYKILGSGFSLFGETDLALNYGRTPSVGGVGIGALSQETKTYGAGLSFYPGVAYRVSRHWQLETGLPGLARISYSHAKETIQLQTPASEVHTTNNSFNASTSLGSYFQFSVGALYVI